jgi:ribose-phosphate pyrophosphokinase
MDLHAAQIQGFFDIPVDNLLAEPVLSHYFLNENIKNLVLVSPDVGNVKRSRLYSGRMNGELAIIDKRRVSGDTVEVGHIIGDVKGRTVLMVDDMISTAGTICEAAKLCKQNGAERILVGTTHAVLCGPAIERLRDAPIDQVIVTDTIPVSDEKLQDLGKGKVLSVSRLMGEAIHRIHNDESVSSLFHMDIDR